MSIAERIWLARKKRKLTQKQLGELIGVSGQAIANYENGSREPDVGQIRQIAKALNVTGDWLIETDFAYQEEETTLLNIFRNLNEAGKEQLMLQAEMISGVENFQKKNSGSAAI